MKFLISREEMEEEVEKLRSNSKDKKAFLKSCIRYYQSILSRYREEIYSYDFKDREEEIFFFRQVKQEAQCELLYYSLLFSFDSRFEITGEPFKKEMIEKEIKYVTGFLNLHFDFFHYIKSNSRHLDQIYFTRGANDYFSEINPLQDPVFNTPKDVLLSRCKAQEKYLKFLQTEINDMSKGAELGEDLKWTNSKVALTELIYALHLSGSINNGNVTLKQLINFFQKNMEIELGDYHHTFLRLRERSNQTKFLDTLQTKLIGRMKELDD